MTYASSPAGFGAFTGQTAGEAAKPGLLRRIYSAFMTARQAQADRDIDLYFVRHGSLLTDAVERDMMQRTISNNWGTRR